MVILRLVVWLISIPNIGKTNNCTAKLEANPTTVLATLSITESLTDCGFMLG